MTNNTLSIVVLAAGHGTRMKSSTPKVLHKIGGREMIGHVFDTAYVLAPQTMCVVVGAHAPKVGERALRINPTAKICVQDPPQGTAHAVAQALPHLDGKTGTTLILYADTPLVSAQTMATLTRQVQDGAAVAVLGFEPENPGSYGRLKQNDKGALDAIVEAKDASDDELAIRLCNSGVMAIDTEFLTKRLNDIDNKNAKSEYYLTDIVALARQDGLDCAITHADADEVMGVNAKDELAIAEKIYQNRRRQAAMRDGVTMLDPDTVYFSYDTTLGKEVTVGPNVVFGDGVVIGDHAHIHGFCHIEGARVAAGADIGPFARLRPGAEIGEKARIGNFVEVKKAQIGEGAKVNHLSYIGDAEIGDNSNIGAGTITCNYDGFGKYKTTIGKNAFIGSNSALVAPINIADDAYIGSGSVVTRDVEQYALSVARARQNTLPGWVQKFRAKKDSSND